MRIQDFFPIWSKFKPEIQENIQYYAKKQIIKQGSVLSDGSKECSGLVLVCSGQLRAYILSDDGREITVSRMFEHDICLLCASCVMPSIQTDIIIKAEKDTEAWIIPPWIYRSLQEKCVVFSNYMNELMAMNFSEVMWIMEQILWKSFDKRLAAFLVEESIVENNNVLMITHEKIPNHLGTAREVVTRMLKHFQTEEMIALKRGTIEIINIEKLRAIY